MNENISISEQKALLEIESINRRLAELEEAHKEDRAHFDAIDKAIFKIEQYNHSVRAGRHQDAYNLYKP